MYVKTCLYAALMIGLLAGGTAAAKEGVKLSPQNTKIEWVGTKPGGQHVGSFGQFSGSFDVASGKLTVEIQTPSLTSDNNNLTNHLKSPDFFNVRKYPKATFTATRLEAKGDGEWTHAVTGDLTLLGKKKTISFPAKVEGKSLTSKFTIDRTHFGMNYGQGKVDNAVTITVQVNAQ